jgi:hypothetical protein
MMVSVRNASEQNTWILLMLIQFLGIDTGLLGTVLLMFQRYVLVPSLVLKCVLLWEEWGLVDHPDQ